MITEVLPRLEPFEFLFAVVRVNVADSLDSVFGIFEELQRDYFLVLDFECFVDQVQLFLLLI